MTKIICSVSKTFGDEFANEVYEMIQIGKFEGFNKMISLERLLLWAMVCEV